MSWPSGRILAPEGTACPRRTRKLKMTAIWTIPIVDMGAHRALRPPRGQAAGRHDQGPPQIDLTSLSNLAIGAAHDLRNLLFVVTAHCNRLAQAMPPDDPNRLDVDAIATAAGR